MSFSPYSGAEEIKNEYDGEDSRTPALCAAGDSRARSLCQEDFPTAIPICAPVMSSLLIDSVRKAWKARYPTGIASRRYRFIYFPVPKAASSSIKLFIARLEGLVENDNPHLIPFDRVWGRDLDRYRDFAAFTVMRDPFDRLLSAYKDKVRGQSGPLTGACPAAVHAGFERYNRLLPRPIFHANMSFETFVRVVARIPDGTADEHFRSQYRLFSTPRGRPLVTHILRFDRLDDDLTRFMAKRGVENVTIEKVRSTDRRDDESFYNDDVRRIVSRRYRRDFTLFRTIRASPPRSDAAGDR